MAVADDISAPSAPLPPVRLNARAPLWRLIDALAAAVGAGVQWSGLLPTGELSGGVQFSRFSVMLPRLRGRP